LGTTLMRAALSARVAPERMAEREGFEPSKGF
jgi:hypothetical protein